jgi:predicted RND superfamily exporter protein
VSRLWDRYLVLAARRPGLLCAGAAVLGAVSLALALRLELHTSMGELLPPGHPAVAALRRVTYHQRLGNNLIVLLESPDRNANLRLLAALRPRLEALVPAVFAEIEWGRDTSLAEFGRKWRWLYAELPELEHAEELLDTTLLEHVNPLAVGLDGDDPQAELKRLKGRVDDALPAAPASPYYEGTFDGRHTVGILLWRGGEGMASHGDRRAYRAVRDALSQLDPARFHPAMRVRYTGHIAQAIEDQDSIREQLTVATLLCTTLILLAIYSYFRRMALVLVIGAPAVLGLLVALAGASLTLGSLNLNTAFLLSIILGNGINSPIVVLSRYGEARLAGADVAASLHTATHEAARGTLAAMAAASCAYGSLLATRFRGFSQFGWLGGAGMLLVWGLTFLVVPPGVHLGERLRPRLLTPRRNLWQRPFAALGRARSRWLLVASCGLAALAIAPLAAYLRDPIEWNLRRLQPERTAARGLWQTAEDLGMNNPDTGYVGSHGALLLDKPAQADAVADALRAQDRALGNPVFKRVRTLRSLLPRDQSAKLDLLARIRRKIDRRARWLDEAERRDALAWRPPDDLHPIDVGDLPAIVRRAFTERDGTVGRLVLMTVDSSHYSDWNGRDLLRLSRRLRVEALGKTWVAASPASVFAGMLETLLADGPRVAAVALVSVVALIVVVLGRARAAFALATQAIGLLWFGGALALLRVKVNFFNFVGLPITLGVGADYAANIASRLDEPRERLLPTTGSAVALCSLTTIIGYSSLLVSDNPALRSFGIVADLGELSCLAAALVFLPSLLSARRQPATQRALS